MRVGDRYGRLSVLVVRGEHVDVVCDCGEKKLVPKYHLQKGNVRSCGCLRRDVSRVLCSTLMDNEMSRAKMAETIKQLHADGYYDQSQKEGGERIAGFFTGQRQVGKCARGEANHIAKLWSIRSPAGVVLTGKSLNNLVRENAEHFNQSDVEWRKNEHGTELWCRASMGLRKLFYDGLNVSQWKGWTKA